MLPLHHSRAWLRHPDLHRALQGHSLAGRYLPLVALVPPSGNAPDLTALQADVLLSHSSGYAPSRNYTSSRPVSMGSAPVYTNGAINPYSGERRIQRLGPPTKWAKWEHGELNSDYQVKSLAVYR